MDLIACEQKIDSYLFKYGFEEKPQTNKERIKDLKKIIEYEKINLDCCEMQRSKNSISTEDYLKVIKDSSVNAHRAHSYIMELKQIYKEMRDEEKEIRREEFKKKIKSIFKK